MSRIAYFGPRGTFTEQAARTFGDAEFVAVETVPLVLAAVRAGDVDAGCVPVENSVEGAVTATMDSLAEDEPLYAVGEAILSVRFSILTRPGVKPEDVKTVASHPHALAQVRYWVADNLPNAVPVATTSTASAAVRVNEGEFDAAVSAPVAVMHYPLQELATGIADVDTAVTRFLLLRRPGNLPEPTGRDRTSLAVIIAHDEPGSLANTLSELALRGINLTRIESRPLRGQFGEYRFYLDLDGHVAEKRVGDALAALHRNSRQVRFLGSYPKADESPSEAPPRATDSDYEAAAQWLAKVREGL
ncbi:prephenate dehydratase [Kibdelosporangium philippinense]|uniref:Prephenate dehydratase n=1 Tax=Kibdelosporangium philippinense TaxID=211113 RepID=A0ABS8ZAM0_9PSEU|nr:prephenate dehydratase [Kibdelosporangium philippinense]MCE7004921.1 prephenate dehydratase [Kibdelosporangium philippinense]